MKNQNLDIKKTLSLLSALFVVFLTLFIIVYTFNEVKRGKYIGQEIESKNTITVTATGDVFIKPDLAVINFSVITEAVSVNEAMAENSQKMNAIINAMKKEGVEDKDLKTVTFYIYPRYEYEKDWESGIYPPPLNGKRVLVGYEITQSLEVKIRNMEKIGDIIQAATENGANQVGNLYFTVDKEDDYKKQARETAINLAKAKARELSSQLGINLVRIVNFSESGYAPNYYQYDKALGLGGGEEAPSIETGENLISTTVYITYEIN